MMIWRSNRAPVAALLVTLTLLVSACASPEPPPADTETVVVSARLASAARIDTPQQIELYGTVEAERTAAVSTRVMAMVTAVAVRDGERVRRGQLLVEIDPQASQGQLSQARGALAQAHAALALAERNFERYEALSETDAASELELDMARMRYQQAKGAVEQAEGAVAAASSVAADSRVVAPFAGRVYQRMVEVGDLAAPGRPLLVLESDGSRRLRVAVPESLVVASGLGEGDSLPVAIDTRADLGRMTGSVVERSPGADPVSHSFDFKIALPVDDLPSGTAGRAWVESGRQSRVVVPADALLRRGGVTLIALQTADGTTTTRVVTVGQTTADGRVEILSGLAGGETVLAGLSEPPPAGARVQALAGTEGGDRS
jgi:RND family efflux transporter MFP subunit